MMAIQETLRDICSAVKVRTFLLRESNPLKIWGVLQV
jgi:hypothetical protein